LFTDTFPTPSGRARFHAVSHRGGGEQPSRDFPLFLTTGRVLAQYQSGTQTRRVRVLHDLASEPIAELHPTTARSVGVADGGSITVTTRRGRATFTVRTTPTIREDTVFVPFHWPDEQSVNQLTSPALDDTSKMPEFKVCVARVSRANRAEVAS
jgi:assimilatory nitrate reductase catalytic subunit